MKLEKLSYKYIYLLSLIFLFVFVVSTSVYAKVMTPTGVLEGTVRVNICGDYIAENPEECDREDFRSLSCSDYGYSFGNLRCNLACDIDSTSCYNTLPNVDDKQPGTSVIPLPQTEKPTVEFPTAVQFLALFDSNGDGVLQASEIPAAIVTWVNAWKYDSYDSSMVKSCDLNKDNQCNIYDFSLLMYHITYPD